MSDSKDKEAGNKSDVVKTSLRSRPSPTKSVKNKSLPSSRIKSSSVTAAKPTRPSRPLGFRAAGAGATTVKKMTGEQRSKTPEKTGSKKACSTPTSDEITMTDMTLDDSCIASRTGSAGHLDETVSVAPVMRMTAGGSKMTASAARPKPHMLPPRMGSMRKAPGTITKTSMKHTSINLETSEPDPDEVTDEMMDLAYAR